MSFCPSIKDMCYMSLGLSTYVGGCYVGNKFELDGPETVVLSMLATAMVVTGMFFLKYKLNQCSNGGEGASSSSTQLATGNSLSRA